MLRRLTLSRTLRTLPLAASLVVCLTTLHAQDGFNAKVIDLRGQVSVLKDGYPEALFLGKEVRPHGIIVTGPDGFAQFRIADGSTFQVFPNAKVVFRDNYPSLMDMVQVWLGRIRVQIDHRLGPNPNRVSTPTAVISVRGTVFDVDVEDADHTTLVVVEEGTVDVRHLLRPSSITLNANEWVRVFADQPIAHVIDRGPFVQEFLRRVKAALYDAVMTHPGGGNGGPVAGGPASGGAQGDQGKNKGSGAPGAPPAPPGTPPPPPGGGGD